MTNPRQSTYLGEFEHLVLLAILQLEEQAHGAPIRQLLEERCQRSVSYGALYSTLRRMRTKGLVAADSEPGQGARPRQVFSVTEAGLEAVRASQLRLTAMSKGLDVAPG